VAVFLLTRVRARLARMPTPLAIDRTGPPPGMPKGPGVPQPEPFELAEHPAG
jgi:hypothetical protein